VLRNILEGVGLRRSWRSAVRGFCEEIRHVEWIGKTDCEVLPSYATKFPQQLRSEGKRYKLIQNNCNFMTKVQFFLRVWVF
jgi:hypothetical protein